MEKPVYHVVVQGNHNAQAFATDLNKEMYWERIVRFKEQMGLALYAFAIFENHAHILVRGSEAEVAGMMRRIAVSYSHWYRRYYNHEGSLFRGKPAMEKLESDGEILKVARFIHQEPVRQGIVTAMDAYPWSSYWMYESEESAIDKDEVTERLRFWGSFRDYMAIREPGQYLREKTAHFGYSDAEVEKLLRERLHGRPNRELEAMPIEMRNYVLAVLRFVDQISILQLARVSGIGRGIVQRITKDDMDLTLYRGTEVLRCGEEGLPEKVLEDRSSWYVLHGIHHVIRPCDMLIPTDARDRYLPSSLVYVERKLQNGQVRAGILGCLDLEQYSRSPESEKPIRSLNEADLNQVLSLLQQREKDAVEYPRIRVVVDDPKEQLIEPLTGEVEKMERLYSRTLPEGGEIRGYAIPQEANERIRMLLGVFGDAGYFSNRYNTNQPPFTLIAVEGENELAAAAMYYEQLKARIGDEKAHVHPARFTLVEINNLRAPSTEILTEYPVLKNIDPEKLREMMLEEYPEVMQTSRQRIRVHCITADAERPISIPPYRQRRRRHRYPLSWLLPILSESCHRYGSKLCFAEDPETAVRMGKEDGCVSFVWDPVNSDALIDQMVDGRIFPRGALRVGREADQRIPFEGRRIR